MNGLARLPVLLDAAGRRPRTVGDRTGPDRPGVAGVVTGALFLVAMFFAPVVSIVPFEAATRLWRWWVS